MNKIIIYVLFIILMYIIYKKLNNQYNYYENINLDSVCGLANHVCMYFYEYILSILRQEDFVNPEKSTLNFLKYFPDTIPYDPILYNKFIKSGITLDYVNTIVKAGAWYSNDIKRLQMWIILKPIINSILDNAFIKSNAKKEVNDIIIHFRCSDVPFIKSHEYFIQRYKFFKEALDRLKTVISNKNIILLSCTTHYSNQNNVDACNKYAYHIMKYIENLNYNINIECNTNLEDFATLFYAPAVISTGGSFSFMSGFFGNGIFLSTEHCDSKNTNCCKNCDKYMISGYNIDHNDVDDYLNVDEVLKLLVI